MIYRDGRKDADKVQDAVDDESLSNCLQVVLKLFKAECTAQDVPAARAHGLMLRRIFESGRCDIPSIIQALFDDVDLAVKCTHRTFLDVTGWCAKQLDPIFNDMARNIELPKVDDVDVHHCVTYPPLRELFLCNLVIIRTMQNGRHHHTRWTAQELQDTAFSYFACASLMHGGQLNNLYLDLVESKVMETAKDGARYTQAALAIAMQFYMRRVHGPFTMNGVDIKDASQELMKQLRWCFATVLDSSTDAEMMAFADAHLWIAYVGALEEVRRERDRARGVLLPSIWFRYQLRGLAERLKVRTWADIRHVG